MLFRLLAARATDSAWGQSNNLSFIDDSKQA